MTNGGIDHRARGSGLVKPLAALALVAAILAPAGAMLAPSQAVADGSCSGIEDKIANTSDLADRLGYLCDEGDSRKCGRMAERVLCEYNAYAAQAGSCRSRNLVRNMTFILDTIGDHGDQLERLERKGDFTNITKVGSAERRRVCQAAGAFGD